MRFLRDNSGTVTCEKCTEIKAAVWHEFEIMKHESLLAATCSVCGAKARDFLREPPRPKPDGVRWREKMAKLEKAGKAYPVAGDLFDAEDDGRS